MAIEREPDDAVVATAEEPARCKGTLIILVSGMLVVIGAVGMFAYIRQGSALRAELAVAKDALKKNSAALAEANARNEALSQQVRSLREHAAAYSTPRAAAESENKKAAGSEPTASVPSAGPSAKTRTVGDKTVPTSASTRPISTPSPPAKAAKVPVAIEDCELVGKPAAEQAATLKRCVGVMDGLSSKGVEKAATR